MTKSNNLSIIESVALSAEIDSGVPLSVLETREGANPELLKNLRTNPNVYNPVWTPEQIKYVDDNLGVLPLEEIANHLGRSTLAVKLKYQRLGIKPASKRPEWVTGYRAGLAIGIDVHSMIRLHNRKLIPTQVLQLKTSTYIRIKWWDLYRWVSNPENFPYFLYNGLQLKLDQIPNDFIRELVTRRYNRWGDEWWTTGQASKYLGYKCSQYISRRILEGKIPAVRYNNWRVKKSVILQLPKKGEHVQTKKSS